MRIPQWVKHIAKCVDPDSSRYALGCVQTLISKGWAYITASDGRLLVSVSYRTKSADMNKLLEGKEFARAVQSCSTKDSDARLSVGSEGIVNFTSDKGVVTIKPYEDGRFPDVEKVFADGYAKSARYTRISLDTRLLSKLCDVFSAAVTVNNKAVDVFFKDAQSAILLCYRTPSGEVIRAALMPVEHDDAVFLGPKDDGKDQQPDQQVQMKPVIGTKPGASGKKAVEFTPSELTPDQISGVPTPGSGVSKSSWISLVESEVQ